jgi:uncharacterized protein (DUF427 family)
MKAFWNGEVVADSEDTAIVEGNHYFPLDSVGSNFLRESPQTTFCPWKGTAHYYTLAVGDEENPDAAWYYPDPKEAAKEIKGRVAFWRGVEVVGGE